MKVINETLQKSARWKVTDKQEKIDVYKCHFYVQDRLLWCHYYPKGCNKCGYLIKVGGKY